MGGAVPAVKFRHNGTAFAFSSRRRLPLARAVRFPIRRLSTPPSRRATRYRCASQWNAICQFLLHKRYSKIARLQSLVTRFRGSACCVASNTRRRIWVENLRKFPCERYSINFLCVAPDAPRGHFKIIPLA